MGHFPVPVCGFSPNDPHARRPYTATVHGTHRTDDPQIQYAYLTLFMRRLQSAFWRMVRGGGYAVDGHAVAAHARTGCLPTAHPRDQSAGIDLDQLQAARSSAGRW